MIKNFPIPPAQPAPPNSPHVIPETICDPVLPEVLAFAGPSTKFEIKVNTFSCAPLPEKNSRVLVVDAVSYPLEDIPFFTQEEFGAQLDESS